MQTILLDESGWNIWEYLGQHYGTALLQFAEKIVVALLVFWIGWKVVNWVMKAVRRLIQSRKVDVTVEKVATSIVSVFLRILVVLQVLGILGIESASIFALLGGSTLVVGLGLQGSLANFAGGMMILLQHTFQVGDYISNGTYEGTVESINIISTRIRTPDNKRITLQNGELSNSAITNFSAFPERRLDFQFSIAYQADIEEARRLILQVMEQEESVLADKDKKVLVQNHGASAIELFAYCWVKREDYMAAGSRIREQVKYAFDQADVSIPFPQMDVHLIQNTEDKETAK